MLTAEDGMKKYKEVFKKIFPDIEEEEYAEMKVGEPMEWDSLHHIQLISELERTFSIRLNMNYVPQFRSFKQGVKILREKYGINME